MESPNHVAKPCRQAYRLFKELLSTFFLEFIELFFPEILEYLDHSSITFLDKEVFTDVTAGETYEVDLLIESKFKQQSYSFLIHVENQSYNQIDFNKRMFRYFAQLHEKFDLPIYPIVIFSYDRPLRKAAANYVVDFPDRQILQFKSINLTDALELKINNLEISQLKELRKASLGFDNPDELQQWLENSESSDTSSN